MRISKSYCKIIISIIILIHIVYYYKIFSKSNINTSKIYHKIYSYLNKPNCSPFREDYSQYQVQIEEQIYPKRLALHLNNSINFKCLNKKENVKLILMWNKYWEESFGFGRIDPFIKNNCPVTNCELTNNKKRVIESDAIIVHGSNFGNLPLIKQRPPNQRWIYSQYESPYHLREILSLYSLPKLNGFFNLSSTYLFNSDFPNFYNPRMYWKLNKNFNENKNFMANKTHFSAAVISNCGAGSKRLEILKELQKFISIDIYGKCSHLKCPDDADCKSFISSKYKFYFSFENSLCKDYITEKFFDIIQYDIIPVVYGGADYSYYIPESGYINMLNFKTLKHLADYLIYLSLNKLEYNSYFKWKKHVKYLSKSSMGWTICDICIHLHLEDLIGIKFKTLNDLDSYFDIESNCSGNKTRYAKQIISKEFSKQIYI